jgi:protein-disulfide isomerase/rhodanese-related sulfurtransferase
MRKSLLLALSLLGLFDSSYLLWVYTSPASPMICLGGGTGCDEVRVSAYSNLWGIPLPAYGVLMYVTLALLVFAENLVAAGLAKLIRWAVTGIAGAGFLFSLYLSGIEAFVLHAWCTWCMISAGSVTLIFALGLSVTLRAAPHPEPQAARALARRYSAICVAALVVGIPAFYYLVHSQTLPPPATASPETLLQRLVRPDSHATGNLQAPVTVVEFADFQCTPCEIAEPVVRQIRAHYGSQIRFVFRHFPIRSIHPQAQEAAEASECAAEQGKFWEAAEKFYQHQTDLDVAALKDYAGELGLDVARFSQCLASGKMAARVRRDAEDARALGVRATPTFFIGQKKVEGVIEPAEFSRLVDQELTRQETSLAQSMPQPSSVSAHPSGGSSSTSPGTFGNSGAGFFTQFQASPLACSEEDASQPEPSLIGTPEARQLFEGSAKALFVDVRQPKEFQSGRIPGAINIPAEEIQERQGSLPKDRDIVLYESGRSAGDVCAASRAAGRLLLTFGFAPERLRVYQEGLAGWEKAGLPLEH